MIRNDTTPRWFHNAVIYEIYPQSFYDSNGDGIGDLPGIVAKLDYVASLGVSAVWLNPCFDSPFQDAGSDVRDYYRVAPRYGTNDDLVLLFAEAKKRGIRVLLDLVPGHTSIQHPWFVASASRAKTPYDNYYCWTRGRRENTGNYRFVSGIAERDGFFMINYFSCQPALNYGFADPDPACPWQLPTDHPDVLKVREEMRNVMKFYLDLGCSGFRVDMARTLVRGRDPEAVRRGLCELWGDYRAWMRKNYPEAVLISEWSRPGDAISAGFDADFLLSLHEFAPAFASLYRNMVPVPERPYELRPTGPSFLSPDSTGNSRTFSEAMERELAKTAGRGYLSIVSGNHDLIRLRCGKGITEMKLAVLAIFTLPGVPTLYYGDEIGMRYVEGVGNVEGSYDRGGSRTPMQWTPGAGAGFSTADPEKFYLPLDPDPERPNVESESADPDSLLNLTRRLIALRRSHEALGGDGEYRTLESAECDAPWIFTRSFGNERFLVVLNPCRTGFSRRFELPGNMRRLEAVGEVAATSENGFVHLEIAPHSGAVFMQS